MLFIAASAAAQTTPPPIPTSVPTCQQLAGSSPIPAGYGAPFDLFSPGKTLLMKVYCDDETTTDNVTIALGDGSQALYIYNQGYVYRNGDWQRVSFSGSDAVSSDWLRGKASAALSYDHSTLAKNNYLVAFMCRWDGSSWKCGCRDQQCAQPSWQLQVFKSGGTTALQPARPHIESISPEGGPVGATVTLRGRNLAGNASAAQSDAVVLFSNPDAGGGKVLNLTRLSGPTITFDVPNSLAPYCPDPNMACTQVMSPVQPVPYQVQVKNQNGTSNKVEFTVTGSGGTGQDTDGSQSDTGDTITSYAQCVAAGNPIMESCPEQCRADGKTFTNPDADCNLDRDNPHLESPTPGSNIFNSTVTFAWSDGRDVEEYYLGVGTTKNSVAEKPWGDIYAKSTKLNTSAEVSGIPRSQGGTNIYVRLWWKKNGKWDFRDYVFKAHTAKGL